MAQIRHKVRFGQYQSPMQAYVVTLRALSADVSAIGVQLFSLKITTDCHDVVNVVCFSGFFFPFILAFSVVYLNEDCRRHYREIVFLGALWAHCAQSAPRKAVGSVPRGLSSFAHWRKCPCINFKKLEQNDGGIVGKMSVLYKWGL